MRIRERDVQAQRERDQRDQRQQQMAAAFQQHSGRERERDVQMREGSMHPPPPSHRERERELREREIREMDRDRDVQMRDTHPHTPHHYHPHPSHPPHPSHSHSHSHSHSQAPLSQQQLQQQHQQMLQQAREAQVQQAREAQQGQGGLAAVAAAADAISSSIPGGIGPALVTTPGPHEGGLAQVTTGPGMGPPPVVQVANGVNGVGSVDAQAPGLANGNAPANGATRRAQGAPPPPQGVVGGLLPAPILARLGRSMDVIRAEYEVLVGELGAVKGVKDEWEGKGAFCVSFGPFFGCATVLHGLLTFTFFLLPQRYAHRTQFLLK